MHEFSQTRQVTNIITIHNVAALVLRPPGRKADGLAPDEERMKEIGDAMADATGYRSQYGWQLYDTSGTTEDWNYAAQGAYGYTIEVGPGSDPTETPENVDPDASFHMPYERGVVREWEGWGPNEGQGLREAMLIAGEAAVNPADHSVIEGRAPAGRVLRLRKEFQTQTDFVCRGVVSFPVYFTGGPLYDVTTSKCVAPGDRISIDDHLDTTMVVPKSGTFQYHVNPSTRPFKRYRYVPAGAERLRSASRSSRPRRARPRARPLRRTPACSRRTTSSGNSQLGTRHRARARDARGRGPGRGLRPLPLPQGGRRQPAAGRRGHRRPVYAGRGGPVRQRRRARERADRGAQNVPGDYVMRIVNYAAEGTTWTANVESFKAASRRTTRRSGRRPGP